MHTPAHTCMCLHLCVHAHIHTHTQMKEEIRQSVSYISRQDVQIQYLTRKNSKVKDTKAKERGLSPAVVTHTSHL